MTPTNLAKAVGISVPYASQLLSDDFEKRREPSLSLALKIYDETRLQLGVLRGLRPEEIEPLRKIAA
jgi:transcriptional regulator with XRE-family HTH domain